MMNALSNSPMMNPQMMNALSNSPMNSPMMSNRFIGGDSDKNNIVENNLIDNKVNNEMKGGYTLKKNPNFFF